MRRALSLVLLLLAAAASADTCPNGRTPNLCMKPTAQQLLNDNFSRIDETLGGMMSGPFDPANNGKVFDRGGMVINVKNHIFGAVGDGTTADTTAFTRATSVCSNGAIVFVPPGTYKVSGITIPSGCTLMGAGTGATTIKLDGTTAPAYIITLGTGTTPVTDVAIRDLTIDGTKASYTSSQHIIGLGVVAERALVQNVYVHDTTAACLVIGGSANTSDSVEQINVADMWCHNPASDSGGGNFWGGYAIVHGSKITLRGIHHTFDDGDSAYGFDIEPNTGQSQIVTDVTLSDSTFMGMVKLHGTATDDTLRVRLSNVIADAQGQSGGGYALNLQDVTDLNVVNSWFRGPADTSSGHTMAAQRLVVASFVNNTFVHQAGSSRAVLALIDVNTINFSTNRFQAESGSIQLVSETTAADNVSYRDNSVNNLTAWWVTKIAGSLPFISQLRSAAFTFAQLPSNAGNGSEVTCSDCARTVPCTGGSSGSTTIARRVGGVWNCAMAGELGASPAAQTIAAGNTITADGCGGIKRITASGAVTTDTTNTFTAPGVTNVGCRMDVCNSGATNTITLDSNANFRTAGAADIALGSYDCVTVESDGSVWWQLTAPSTNATTTTTTSTTTTST